MNPHGLLAVSSGVPQIIGQMENLLPDNLTALSVTMQVPN